jgi:hypothetical protein
VAVLLAANQLGRPFGDPLYHPIYEAAVEMGLVIALHPGIDRPNVLVQAIGGPPAVTMEASSQYPHYTMDRPEYSARLLPAAWHRKVFFESACSVYGWDIPSQS